MMRLATAVDGPGEPIKIDRDQLQLQYWQEFLSHAKSTHLLETLTVETPWEEGYLNMYGRRLKMPRLMCWYGDPTAVYTYSGIRNEPRPWTNRLLALKEQVERTVAARFNSVLLNLYRDGRDSMSWHSDDEAELGRHPSIASVSLGAPRRFNFRR